MTGEVRRGEVLIEREPPPVVDWDAWRVKCRRVLELVRMRGRYELLAPLSRRTAAHEAEVRTALRELAGTPYQPDWPPADAIVVDDDRL